jgi:hypothetical protein
MPFSTEKHTREIQPTLPLLDRLGAGSRTFATVGLVKGVQFVRGWHQYFVPWEFKADSEKTYQTRPQLPIR